MSDNYHNSRSGISSSASNSEPALYKKSKGSPEVAVGTEDAGILARVADTLGVLPDLTPPLAPQYHDVKLVICVEGPNDVAFPTAISRIAH